MIDIYLIKEKILFSVPYLYRGVVFLLLCTLLSCTAPSHLFDSPPKLLNSPDSSGLLIIDTEIRSSTSLFGMKLQPSIMGATLQSSDHLQISLTNKDAYYNLIITSKLSAGSYLLKDVQSLWQWQKGQYGQERIDILYTIPDTLIQTLTFTVQNGRPTYVGRLFVLSELAQEGKHEYKVEINREYQLETYKRVLELYSKSHWSEVLKKEIANIENK